MNDIVTRIKEFLSIMGIANSVFADICGIPRPSLSQMLNGRNRKVSNEVIDKIHAAYPQLNMMWLMFGDGDMIVPNANIIEDGDPTQVDDKAFPGNATAAGKEQHQQQAINFDDIDDDAQGVFSRRKSAPQHRAASGADNAVMAARNAAVASQQRSAASKYVTQIMLIFSDGSTQIINVNP